MKPKKFSLNVQQGFHGCKEHSNTATVEYLSQSAGNSAYLQNNLQLDPFHMNDLCFAGGPDQKVHACLWTGECKN